MTAIVFNQPNGTLLSQISPLFSGDVNTLGVNQSKLQATNASLFAVRNAYFTQVGSAYCSGKFTAGLDNQYSIYTNSPTGDKDDGYNARVQNTTITFLKQNVFARLFSLPLGLNINTDDVQFKMERIGNVFNFYGGTFSDLRFIGTYTDPSLLPDGFSGFSFNSNGYVTCGIVEFDGGININNIQSDQTIAKGIARGIERGIV